MKDTIGGRIKAARECRNISQEDLIDEINNDPDRPKKKKTGLPEDLGYERYRRWEDGTNGINLDWVPTICKHLQCDVGYLFGEYEEHTEDIAFICRTTGLSEKAVRMLTFNAEHQSCPPKFEPASHSRIIDRVLSNRQFYDMVNLLSVASIHEACLYASFKANNFVDLKRREEFLALKESVRDDFELWLLSFDFSLVDSQEMKQVLEYRIRQSMDVLVKETFDTVLQNMVDHFVQNETQKPKFWCKQPPLV